MIIEGFAAGAAVAVRPDRGTLTDRSGTIAVAATQQTLAGANPTRRYLLIQNLDAAASLWVNFTTNAVQTQPSLELKPGAVFTMESGFVSNELVSVVGPNAGQAFAAKEG